MIYPLLILFKKENSKDEIMENVRNFIEKINLQDFKEYPFELSFLAHTNDSKHPNAPIALKDSKERILKLLTNQNCGLGMDLIDVDNGKEIELFKIINQQSKNGIIKRENIEKGINSSIKKLKSYLKNKKDNGVMLFAIQLTY